MANFQQQAYIDQTLAILKSKNFPLFSCEPVYNADEEDFSGLMIELMPEAMLVTNIYFNKSSAGLQIDSVLSLDPLLPDIAYDKDFADNMEKYASLLCSVIPTINLAIELGMEV